MSVGLQSRSFFSQFFLHSLLLSFSMQQYFQLYQRPSRFHISRSFLSSPNLYEACLLISHLSHTFFLVTPLYLILRVV
jgi:hypothetical protein